MDYNHAVLLEVVQKYGDPEVAKEFEPKASRWLKSFECKGKKGIELHLCWSNCCTGTNCKVDTFLKRPKGGGLSPFEKKYKIKAPDDLNVDWGFYHRYNDDGTTREKWVPVFLSWNEFLSKYGTFCAAKQTYLHVYSHYMKVTKVNSFQFALGSVFGNNFAIHFYAHFKVDYTIVFCIM